MQVNPLPTTILRILCILVPVQSHDLDVGESFLSGIHFPTGKSDSMRCYRPLPSTEWLADAPLPTGGPRNWLLQPGGGVGLGWVGVGLPGPLGGGGVQSALKETSS